jgi:hypothetical protein
VVFLPNSFHKEKVHICGGPWSYNDEQALIYL